MRFGADHPGQHLFLQRGSRQPDRGKKLVTPISTFLEEQVDFLRVALEKGDVIGNAAQPMNAHPALDPPIDRAFLV